MVVTGVKVAEAPGAAASEDELKKNDQMYILETTSAGSDDKSNLEVSQGERLDPEVILAQFKQRNAVLRRALLFPDILTEGRISPPVSNQL